MIQSATSIPSSVKLYTANIGICQIGTIEFERIAQYFDLKESHICVHSMVGGTPAEPVIQGERDTAAGKASDILRRVRELSDQEARDLLDSQKRDGSWGAGGGHGGAMGRVIGTAITVQTRAVDNLAPYAALKYAREGDVLVVACDGSDSASVMSARAPP